MPIRTTKYRAFLCIMAATVLAGTVPAAKPEMLLENGGFELLAKVPGVPDTGGKHRGWTVKGGPLMPAQWDLSSHYYRGHPGRDRA